ncbi:hypothetical protein ACH5RR_035507 [Cinchona calisaya]|uniref:Pentatricopeptide repeat-containing protein n=1 Tax=Cinchona calisaya TaxID=153742 RepID=A0ABD2Y0N6_9GENT
MFSGIARKNILLLLPVNHAISHVTFRNYLRYFSSLSSLSHVKQCHLKRDSDLDLLVRKIVVGSSEDEVFQILMQDPACGATEITHDLIGRLLNRFKDDWKSALGIFRWAESHRGYKPAPEFYDKVVDTLGKMKQMEKMRVFVEEMNMARLVSLNTIAKVMRRFAGAGEWKDAVRTFDEMDKFRLEKNTESMNLLLDTLCKESKVEQAREIFLKLKLHIPPNAHTFNIFIHGWCKINRVEEAQWTIQEMKGHGCRPTVISYSTIIQFYCHQFNFRRVHELLDEMQDQRCTPNVVTYTTIMHSLTKSEAFEESLKIVDRMKSSGCKPDTLFYNVLLHTLGRAGRVHEAIHVFKVEMPQMKVAPNTSTYNTAIAMLCHHGQEEAALDFLRDIQNSPYCEPDVQTYFPLLKSCFRAGKKDDCLSKLLDDMSSKRHLSFDLSTYALLIHGLCKRNKAEEAYNLFVRMMAQGIRPRYVTCRLLLEEIKQKNMHDAAKRVEDFVKKMKTF